MEIFKAKKEAQKYRSKRFDTALVENISYSAKCSVHCAWLFRE